MQIPALDFVAMKKCQVRIDNLTKPLNSLHYFEIIAKKLAGITENPSPKIIPRKILVLKKEEQEVDLPLAIFAKRVQAPIVSISIPRLRELSTGTYFKESLKICSDYIREEKQIIGLGQNGIDAEKDCQLIFDYYCQNEIEQMPFNKIDKGIVFLSSLIIAAAQKRCLVVLDGLSTSLAALIATKINPKVKDYLLASHYSISPKQREALELLDIPAYLHLDLQGDCGLGAALGISLVDAALHMLNDMKTFGEADVAVANDGPGAIKQNKNIKDM
ncbi:nicotinate-nucleotide--dimethylbenzimidazole phosphoribosyltransferase [Succinispira mobilis]|uniref:nicotinate-nucleotide--dimethylbenzimidazole phosphoribosyltransferase n=1 Tax=Succinispira mobilis TaxID=78120 RepID=UPI001FE15FCE|nr:nicotinate-nucleotide--dimethylbenzimidazole phosphoribosyltransferase [Succinispira mobilis]